MFIQNVLLLSINIVLYLNSHVHPKCFVTIYKYCFISHLTCSSKVSSLIFRSLQSQSAALASLSRCWSCSSPEFFSLTVDRKSEMKLMSSWAASGLSFAGLCNSLATSFSFLSIQVSNSSLCRSMSSKSLALERQDEIWEWTCKAKIYNFYQKILLFKLFGIIIIFFNIFLAWPVL